jgi:hypothetical protein
VGWCFSWSLSTNRQHLAPSCAAGVSKGLKFSFLTSSLFLLVVEKMASEFVYSTNSMDFDLFSGIMPKSLECLARKTTRKTIENRQFREEDEEEELRSIQLL